MKQKQYNYAFIDSQNVNLAIRSLGWKLDFKRFRIFLKDKYKIDKAFLFLGYIEKNKRLYEYLQNSGYDLIFKPITQDKEGIVKGNCDAELVLQCMIEYNNFDKAIIVSGDGDFHCLIEYLKKNKKLLKVGVPSRKNYSRLLLSFRSLFFFIEDLKKKIEK